MIAFARRADYPEQALSHNLFHKELVMKRFSVALAVLALVLVARVASAADDKPAFAVAEGKVDKIGKDTVTIQPRTSGGKFGKAITLKITGTTKVATISMREQGGKPVVVQRETDAKDLKKDQEIAVIYAVVKKDNILLAAVVKPTD
jgi:hypothetical protein